jgi:UDP-GlcNAc3NAcA epimerase
LNLYREGISGKAVQQVGDVMFDAALLFSAAAHKSNVLDRLGLSSNGFVLLTIHRAENTDHVDRLVTICDALSRVASDMPVVFPAHPRTRRLLCDLALGSAARSLKICDPLGYVDMQRIEQAAAVIVTDSGGVQKEAFFHRRPCVTLRNETEWVELLDLGWNRLVPPEDAPRIVDSVLSAIGTSGADASPFGDGHAAERVATLLAES